MDFRLLILLYFLHVSSLKAEVCKPSDYQRILLKCGESRTRSAAFYLKPDALPCEVKDPPPPIKDIPCDCPPGKGLSDNKCSDCQPGDYSAGGEIIQDWRDWNATGIPGMAKGFIVNCEFYNSRYNSKKACAPWSASDDFQSIHSGDNRGVSCIQSSIITQKNFVGAKKQVEFEYRVDGGRCYSRYSTCDGLAFYIDNFLAVNFVSFKHKWTKLVFNVTKGSHKFRWVFHKRCYGSTDFARGYVKSITFIGTEEPNTSCHPCPAGSFSSSLRSEVCTKCPFFTYQNKTGQTSCAKCLDGEYSLPGETTCKQLPNCTQDHIITSLEPLDKCIKEGDKYTRTRNGQYLIPPGVNKPLCRKNSGENLASEKVPCKCQPGLTLKEGGSRASCSRCPLGYYSDGISLCAPCPGGKAAVPGKHYFIWEHGPLPEGFKSECVGDDCPDKEGWMPADTALRTGRVLGSMDAFLTSPTYNITSPVANITYRCSVVCNVTNPLPERGAHLAREEDCFLQTVIEKDGQLFQSHNCTDPKNRYVYRHQDHRDGEVIFHQYKLPPGNYTFRWQFHQADAERSSSAVFGANLFNISIVGVDVGEAKECFTCLPGYYSKGKSGQCEICPNGTYSSGASSQCTPCPDNTFADKPGTSQCLSCGKNTKTSINKDGCDNGGCKFSPKQGIEFDVSALSRPGQQMFEYKVKQVHSYPHRHYGRYSRSYIPRRNERFYFNFCTIDHDNSSCTIWNERKRVPMPTMACSSYSWGRDRDMGNVIGYKPNPVNITSGFTIELTNGGVCYKRYGGKSRVKTEIEMVCDLSAGVGYPDRPSNSTPIRVNSCLFKFRWHSMYGCPKCRSENLVETTSVCSGGYMNKNFVKTLPCWGTVEGKSEEITRIKCSANVDSSVMSNGSKINNLLIGLGVLFVLVLLIIIAYFIHKNRTLKYNYYKMLNKRDPTIMSELVNTVERDENMEFGRGKFM